MENPKRITLEQAVGLKLTASVDAGDELLLAFGDSYVLIDASVWPEGGVDLSDYGRGPAADWLLRDAGVISAEEYTRRIEDEKKRRFKKNKAARLAEYERLKAEFGEE